MTLGIHSAAGKPARYFFGDNIEGYLEGFTHQTGGGSGYWLDGQPLFRDFTARAGRLVLTKETATNGADILPHGVRHTYEGVHDECSVLHRQRAIALTVTPSRKTTLGCGLLFDPGAGEQSVKAVGPNFTITFKGHRLAAGIAASAPITLSGPDTTNGLSGPVFTTTTPQKTLTLYIAFDRDARRAAKRAEKLARTNALATHHTAIDDLLTRSRIDTGHPDYDRAVAWAKLTSIFLVTEEFGKGIWAGLPWFKNNWGRDTFIALPGTLLVTGLFDEARDVILNFLRYQDRDPASPTYGRVPNRVASATDIIYNTADGTPWLIRELYEYLQYTGDIALAQKTYPQVKLALEGAITKFVDAEGFLTHDDADTWMDARIMGNLPWSARGNRANDIQALWHNALLTGAKLAGLSADPDAAARWNALAALLKTNFTRRFWNAKKRVLADRITADNRRDEKVRPNQLMVLSIPMIEPLLNDQQAARVVEQATTELLYPYGIASLSQNDRYFHPYHHNDDWYHFDAAYHNGTVWGWNAGFTVTALCRTGQTELAAKLTGNLTQQILTLGCLGSMSELLEALPRPPAKSTPACSGTWAQAWSASEFARNAYQDFGGFHPRLLDHEIHLHPHLPKAWENVTACFPFGRNAHLIATWSRTPHETRLILTMTGHRQTLDVCLDVELENWRYQARLPLRSDLPLQLSFQRGILTIDDLVEITGQKMPRPAKLKFAKPSLASRPPCLRKKNYLQQIIEAGKFK